MLPVDPVALLCELIAIPSVNPMGGPDKGSPYGESRLASFLEGWFQSAGIDVERRPVVDGQENILARLPGDCSAQGATAVVLLDAHMDTVPVEGMRIPPFQPEVRDGRIYGRGACDVKGGMAAMLTALARLAALPQRRRPTVVMACTVNEENGFSGAEHLVSQINGGASGLLPRRPDAAVIAEPTGLNVVVAHKGVVRWRCNSRGKAAHSSRPESGENAIYRMARAVLAMERYQGIELRRLASHALCGPASLSVGTIRGGTSVNTVPDRCTVEIDRRLVPGETPDAARAHLIEYLAREPGLAAVLEHEPAYLTGPALSDETNGPLAERLAAAAKTVLAECPNVGVPYATDAAFYSNAGIPAVVFGPGELAQAHTDNEWVSVEQLQQAAEIYLRFLQAYAP